MEIILLIVLCGLIILFVMVRKRYKDKNGLKGNLHIGFKPVFADAEDNRYYNIVCKCGNKFSVKTNAEWVECDKCRSFDKLALVVSKFYDSLGK